VALPGARLLVLGSFPSVASLQAGAYYAHPRNHFWPIVAAILGDDLLRAPLQHRAVLASQRGLAIWDVYAQCRREGSLDSAIHDAVPNDLAALVQRLPALRGMAHNGGESARAMRLTRTLGLPVWRLPSTSPANASWSLARKQAAWAEAFAACGLPVPPEQTDVWRT
jgi:hypoxanthine-DNA glycosylase